MPLELRLMGRIVLVIFMYTCKNKHTEGGNRQNRLYLESKTPSWARLWTLNYMPCICRNNIPAGKPDPSDERAPGLVPRLSIA